MSDLKQFQAFLEEQTLAKKTIKTYINSISRMLEKYPDNPTNMITRANLSNASRHTYKAALTQYATFTEDEELFASLNSVSMKRKLTKVTRGASKSNKAVQPFSLEEVDSILAVIDKWHDNFEHPPWLWASLSLMIKLGLRAGVDLAWMEKRRIQAALDDGRVLIIVTKGSKERKLPIITVMEELETLVALPKWKYLSDLISPTAKKGGGTDAAYQVISRKLKMAAKLAGIDPKGVHTHRFRHTAAHRLYNKCQDLLVVRDFLGHTSTETTMKYLRADRMDAIGAFLVPENKDEDEEE